MVDRRLGGVEVLGALVVIQEPARAEAEGLAGDVADRPDEPAAEAVIGAAVALAGEASGEELCVGVAEGAQVLAEGVVALRGEPDAEAFGRGRVEASLPQEAATRLGLRRAELSDEELFGGAIGREQARAVAVVGVRLAAVFVVQLEADAGRHALHRLGEAHVVDLLQEGEDVAVFAASEAVVAADLRSHVEARAALVVERAEPLERPDSGTLE